MVPQKLEQLTKDGGDLERVLRQHVGDESTLVRMVAMRAKLKSSLLMPGASRDYEARLAVLDTALADVGG